MRRLTFFAKIGAIVLLPFFVTACGTNLFEGLVSQDTGNTIEKMEAKLDDASSASDFQEIQNLADGVINDPNATSQEKQQAFAVKSQAILGQNNIGLVDVIGDLYDFNNTSSVSGEFVSISQTAPLDNIFELFFTILNSIDSQQIQMAAIAINTAHHLSIPNNALLPEDLQFIRTVVNILAAARMLTQELAISGTSSPVTVSLRDTNDTFAGIVIALMDPDGNNTVDSINYSAINSIESLLGFTNHLPVTYFVSEAVDALPNSGGFLANQTNEIRQYFDSVQAALDEFTPLYNALHPTPSTYSFGGKDYDMSSEDGIRDALQAIFDAAI